MAQHRRASSTQSGGNVRQSLGEPYQIYTEVVNAGKNLQGSKRKVKWLFGFTESDTEHEVVLVHSLVSGKKTIFEDGREIVASSNILATDFSHGWSSESCNRLFRIEASIGMTSDHLYTFSVDGVKFIDMPRKPLNAGVGPKSNSNDNSQNKDSHRRTSTTGSLPAQQPPRSNFQSPFAPSAGGNASNNTSSTFDPFGDTDNSNSEFDPFGTAPSSVTSKSSASTHTAGSQNKSTPVHATVGHKVTPTSANKPKGLPTGHNTNNRSGAAALFNGFDDDNSAATSNSNNTSATFDPFGGGDSSSSAADPFASGGHSIAGPPPSAHKKLEPKRSSVAAEPDLFGNFAESETVSATTFGGTSTDDLFSGHPVVNASKPQRRSSAQEISLDFAGLSFVAESPKQKSPVFVAPPAATLPEETPFVDPASKDPWGATKNLVDLDLSGRSAAQKQSSRASVTQGPSLDNLLGVNNNSVGARRASFTNGPATQQFQAAALGGNSQDPFGAPSLVPLGGVGLHSTSMYGQNQFQQQQQQQQQFGMPPAPAAPVYGRGLGGAAAPPVFTSGNNNMQQMPPQGGVRGSIGGMPSSFNYQQQQQQQQQQQSQQQNKNSLDSLNWKM